LPSPQIIIRRQRRRDDEGNHTKHNMVALELHQAIR
jgi:hypothetical protein